MNADAVLKELRAISKESTAKIYSRHGIRDVILGASHAGIGAIVKKLDPDFPLAEALWRSGVREARIADPETLTPDAVPYIKKMAAHRAKRKRR